MGCDYYNAEGKLFHFNEMDEELSCLCTFPHNDGNEISSDRLRSLAYLGAAIVLAHQGLLSNEQYQYITDCLPAWIIRDIDKGVK